jgi:hypothetical protein
MERRARRRPRRLYNAYPRPGPRPRAGPRRHGCPGAWGASTQPRPHGGRTRPGRGLHSTAPRSPKAWTPQSKPAGPGRLGARAPPVPRRAAARAPPWIVDVTFAGLHDPMGRARRAPCPTRQRAPRRGADLQRRSRHNGNPTGGVNGRRERGRPADHSGARRRASAAAAPGRGPPEPAAPATSAGARPTVVAGTLQRPGERPPSRVSCAPPSVRARHHVPQAPAPSPTRQQQPPSQLPQKRRAAAEHAFARKGGGPAERKQGATGRARGLAGAAAGGCRTTTRYSPPPWAAPAARWSAAERRRPRVFKRSSPAALGGAGAQARGATAQPWPCGGRTRAGQASTDARSPTRRQPPELARGPGRLLG